MAVLRRIINRIRSQREEGEVQATYYHTEVVPAMDELRARLTNLR